MAKTTEKLARLTKQEAIDLSQQLEDEARSNGKFFHSVIARCPESHKFFVWFDCGVKKAPEAPQTLLPYIDGRV